MIILLFTDLSGTGHKANLIIMVETDSRVKRTVFISGQVEILCGMIFHVEILFHGFVKKYHNTSSWLFGRLDMCTYRLTLAIINILSRFSDLFLSE